MPMKISSLCVAILVAIDIATNAAEPKRLLVVGATAAFRHPSVENGETNSVLKLIAVSSGNAGNYFVTVTNTYGSVTSTDSAEKPPVFGNEKSRVKIARKISL